MDTVTSKNKSKFGVPAVLIDYESYGKLLPTPWSLNHWAREATIVVLYDNPDFQPDIDDDRISVVIKNTGDKFKDDFYKHAVSVLKDASNLIPVIAIIRPDDLLGENLKEQGVLVVLHG